MSIFRVPITHEYIQNLTDFDIAFINWSSALDDPKFRDKVKNTYYDPGFDEWANSDEEA